MTDKNKKKIKYNTTTHAHTDTQNYKNTPIHHHTDTTMEKT